MINIQNPLITYIAWLAERDLCWADSIADSFFAKWQIMDETKKLLDVSKEEYEAKHKEIMDYMDACKRGEEATMPAMLPWDEGDYDYGDDDEYILGIRLKRLITYLYKFIELDSARYIVQIALNLFQHTDYMLYSYSTGMKSRPDWLENYHHHSHLENLLAGNIEQANYDKQELKLRREEIKAMHAAKASWDRFIRKDFNQRVIYYYDTKRLYGG
jgi:hypothetical protein